MSLLVSILPSGFFCFAEFNEFIQNDYVSVCSILGNAYLHPAAFEGAAAMNNPSQKNNKLNKIFGIMDGSREGKLIRFHPDINEKELDEIKYLARSDNRGNNTKGEIW